MTKEHTLSSLSRPPLRIFEVTTKLQRGDQRIFFTKVEKNRGRTEVYFDSNREKYQKHERGQRKIIFAVKFFVEIIVHQIR
jgi:hypothetical protein